MLEKQKSRKTQPFLITENKKTAQGGFLFGSAVSISKNNPKKPISLVGKAFCTQAAKEADELLQSAQLDLQTEDGKMPPPIKRQNKNEE